MRIELENLGKSREFRSVLAADELSLDDHDLRLIEPAEVSGRASRNGDEVKLGGRLRTRVEAACARCLKPVQFPIDIEFSERFVPGVSWRSEEEHQLREEDLDLAVLDGDAVDVGALVSEEILLAMPSQVLCRQDCKGLCPTCGIDKNEKNCTCESRQVDSRWKALKNLRF